GRKARVLDTGHAELLAEVLRRKNVLREALVVEKLVQKDFVARVQPDDEVDLRIEWRGADVDGRGHAITRGRIDWKTVGTTSRERGKRRKNPIASLHLFPLLCGN